MRSTGRSLIFAAAGLSALLMMGFVVFATWSTRLSPSYPPAADGIVVLTGAQQRIEAGLQLLREGLGRRLLISGVNRRTTPGDVLRKMGADLGPNGCCIDFGYAAQDTVGNASETKAWADRHNFTRLIVVTSTYHMPRTLNELALALPQAELIAYPVLPRTLSEGMWWLKPGAARVLVAEYFKLLPSYARYAAHRLLHPHEPVAGHASSDRTRSRAAAL
jgi:uncharacterized SAM-binding protein YcdF (DUF218 family)